jgi:cytochrome P450 family 142 subfamily A polypeptide 1
MTMRTGPAAPPPTPLNVLDPEFYVDPWDDYRWLRDHAPLYRDEANGVWAVSRYHDLVDTEKDSRRYSSAKGSRPHIYDPTSMINMDDPQHTNFRRLVARRFTPKAVRDHEAEVRRTVTQLIDRVAPTGRAEVVEDLASRLPAVVIGRALGYPDALWEKVRAWSEITMHEAGQYPADGSRRHPGGGERSMAAVSDLAADTVQLIARRRQDPEDDLISVWCHTEVERLDGTTSLMTDPEIISEALLVLDGGAETTRTVIGAIAKELAERPDQKQALVDDPALLGRTAVEEFIRWVSPILNMKRTATEDHEVRGQQVHEGDELVLLYASANRDERAFDEPDRFDVRRAHNHQVAFGFGTHFCLGASLARLEIRVMFEELTRRIPDWRLAPGAAPRIVPASFTRAYDAVPIEFTPTATEGTAA